MNLYCKLVRKVISQCHGNANSRQVFHFLQKTSLPSTATWRVYWVRMEIYEEKHKSGMRLHYHGYYDFTFLATLHFNLFSKN